MQDRANKNKVAIEAKEEEVRREMNLDRFQDIAFIVQFDYQNPYANFNRSLVYGRFSTLFKVQELEKYSVALNAVAGNKLLQVVVEDKNVAKDILQSRVLRHHVTFVPLQQIHVERLPRANVEKVMQLTNNKARLALDLIQYDPRFEPAMQQVFGKIFVCDDAQTAKQISQQRGGYVCVTRQGDKYEPTGLLHGGSQDNVDKLKKI